MNHKTSHQLARELLAGPDLHIVIATQKPRGDKIAPCDYPKTSQGEGYDSMEGGDSEQFIEIHAACEKPSFADDESL